jgi:hypothetical protein
VARKRSYTNTHAIRNATISVQTEDTLFQSVPTRVLMSTPFQHVRPIRLLFTESINPRNLSARFEHSRAIAAGHGSVAM